MKKRVLVIGDYKAEPSEGMEVITKRFVDFLEGESFDVKTVTTKKFLLVFPFLIYRFDRVVFTHGPGKGAYYLSILISILRGPSITWLATRPTIKQNNFMDTWLSELDQIYCGQENVALRSVANAVGASFSKVIIGIDTSRVKKRSFDLAQVKRELMGEDVDVTVPLVLHVGHLRHNRGLEKLINIKTRLGSKANILVIGSPSLSKDVEVIEQLEKNGIYIFSKYLKSLDQAYQVADIYAFPVDPINGGAIDLPLSVIEALACGTHVVSTSFGVLKDYLMNHPGVVFADANFEDVVVEAIINKNLRKIKSNELPSEFDLDCLIEKIIKKI